jgi:cytohesin
MKHLLLTTIAAVLLVGCGPSAPDISIHKAAREGNIEAIKQHIAAGTDVNAKGDGESTPLHRAAYEGHKETAELLIAEGADVNLKDQFDSTPLHEAAYEGHKEIVELLIAKGADVNAKNDNDGTPLRDAAEGGHKEIAELLIAKGAGVNAKSDDGETPLDYAEGETAVLLRKHGGKTSYWFKAGESIHIATVAGHIEAVKQHLAAGADVNAKDDGESTPLHNAASEGHKEIAELLIDKGADVNAKDDGESTPLHNTSLEGYKETAELLIAKGADVNAKDEDGKTPLDYANEVWEDASPEDKAVKKEIATLLRKHGGKSSAEDSIHAAALVGNVEAVQQHLDSGVDVNTKNKLGRTPMLYAIQGGHKEIGELLISKGAIQVPRIRINDAVRQSNIEAIKQHLAVGTNVDGRDYAGETPLYLAADFGDKDIVELLINGGANVNAISYKRISESKYTALDSALRSIGTLAGEPSSSHKAIVNLLRKHGGKTKKELEGEGK